VALIIIIIVTIILFFFYRSKYGTVIKGFGNNPVSMVRSGWSQFKAYTVIFGISGLLVMLAGMVLSGIIASSDSTAMGAYTIPTVAAVILGGGTFTGGVITVSGVLFGAITLSLVSLLLGFLAIPTAYNAAVQGCILILIIAVRALKGSRKKLI
jgi:ribose transport system ATP-binding protein